MEQTDQTVYISCVVEVRYSFVSHLSDALRREGISVFVDSDDLLSKEAQQKVEIARVSVIVLPGNRKVCLEKLTKVLSCQRDDDQVVVPVLYGDSQWHHEWLNQLRLRGFSTVYQSRKECNDSEPVEEIVDSELVEVIVRDVNEKLSYMGRIGIYSKLLEIENMVNKQPLGVRCLGIWGMPRIGKTTLAKAFFDQVSGEFDACCFIEDFDKAIHEKRIYRVLVEQLKLGHGSKLSLRRDKLIGKRVLVVLDDVRNPLAAESFLDEFEWFGPESLIIITSRDKRVFRLCQVNHIYEVQGLNEEEARQLFLLCASRKDTGEQNLHELSLKVLNYAKGNPVAISIYGRANGLLTTRLEIFDAFKSSYDTLSDSEKNIFLDIACFFEGENVDYVKQLFEGCGFFPHVGIDVLVDKCLVTISENRVWMHNLTQDVGREIVNRETVLIERRNRLWEPGSIQYLLEDNEQPTTTSERAQGTEEIEGMFLDTLNLSFDVKSAAFENMLNLRLLKIYCSSPEVPSIINFREGLNSLPNELRLLHWENYPLKSLPQSFDPIHLVEINMPHSQLEKLWDGTKNLDMLRTIKLCHCQELVDIGDLSRAQNIEVIDLEGCTKLQSFPATGQLLQLRVVNLSGCREIKSFSEFPPNIEKLHLQGTGIKELPLSFVKPNGEELVSLLAELQGLSDALKFERLSNLVKSSSSSQDLRKLICLELKDCSRLQSLPNMVSLEFVKVLDLSGCTELETIHGLPRNLEELYLAGTAVREVSQLPRSLELLDAHGCTSLKSILLDSEKLPMHCTFSNCFNLSPQMVNDFLVKALANVKQMLRKHQQEQELNRALAFRFCAPSHADKYSSLVLQPGSSVMTHLTSSWRNVPVGFFMLVEVAFSDDYYDVNGFGISCVCRWKNREGHSHSIERNMHCWAAGKAAPKVRKNHMFVLYDAKMHPSTGEGNHPDILGNLVIFDFVPVNLEKKRLDDSCTVTRCGIYAINGNTDLKMSSPFLSSDPMDCSGDQVEEVLRVSYDGLEERDKALFRYIACLFNDEDFDLVAPLIASIDVDIKSGLKELASKSLIRVSSNEEIMMHSWLRKMWKESIHSQSMLPGSSKDLTRDVEEVSMASSSSRNWKYDVFASFSGQDVRKSFVSHLVAAFKHKSITTFEDDKEDKGTPIGLVQAIRESRISIVVFSKRYASSSWLLGELVEITKSRQELGQTVVPIFYDVDPSDVRKQTGEFGRHFKQTSKGKTEDEEQQWQQALRDIANIAGYHCSNWVNDAEMIEKIATDVSNKLNCTPSPDFDGLVGIDAHIAKIIPLLSLELESEEVKMVGIWGPSGIGKTTIARYLYNKISSTFQCCAFIDIPNGYNKRGHTDDYSAKLYMQQLVLSEIVNVKDVKTYHLGVMQDRLKDKKVLLILDGVDDRLVLDATAGNSNWFGPGSRIIVTTKDLALLESHGISCFFKMDLPSKKEAIQMLCLYAFGQKYPFDGFMELATEVTELAGNLPLGLRFYGSYLRGKSDI